MKKLMFAVAAMSAGVLFADITSNNVVGYNSTAKVTGENMSVIGASFENVSKGAFIPLNAINAVEGIAVNDQIQVSYMDGGVLNFKVYEYWGDDDGWADLDTMEPVGDTVGLSVGQGAWFLSTEPKQITFAGGVKKENHIHTFSETMSVIVSAFPVGFCPNSANVSWGCNENDQLQTSFFEDGVLNFKVYEYWGSEGWADLDTMEPIAPDFAINTAGKGFWFISSDPENASFSEVSPIAE